MKKIKTVIIDDNQHAILGLKEDIGRWFPDLEIAGEADGVVAGAKILRQLKPDLLLLDIQMGDGTGFDLLEIVPDLNFQLIFTTAHDEHALRAFRFAAVDYLLKPIDPDELKVAIDKAKKNIGALASHPEQLPVLQEHFQASQKPETIAFHTAEKIQIAKLNNILRMESSSNYTHVFFDNQEKILLTKTLKEFSQLLEPAGFLRVHQSHLINMNFIKEFVKTDGGYIVMVDGKKVPVSVRKRAEVVAKIEGL
ncbi:MAG: LytTR family DNA-binding domain-containing protein [Bacteroidota bacterium]